jgi:hypothetical protein
MNQDRPPRRLRRLRALELRLLGSANYGQVGYSQNTFISQGTYLPTTFLRNPFPNGVTQPRGNSLGAYEGVGSNIEFIDQEKGAPYVQQYSFDINREMGGSIAVGFEYSGATGRNLGLGGANDSATLNINQLETHLRWGASPRSGAFFFGTGTGSRNSPTITGRGRRPSRSSATSDAPVDARQEPPTPPSQAGSAKAAQNGASTTRSAS